ncbi:F-box/kelch-repeat protein At3g06240-like [Bidens hawaiensis]|uniref:F-box/kelch-repeat protein At3g06240-like n=1 Tax=Bidens hawaiensis TaxID=980011 RepID=UPI00404A32CA
MRKHRGSWIRVHRTISQVTKIVKITYADNPPEVEIFTLSTGAWRRSDGNFPSHILIKSLIRNEVVVDGVLYWVFNAKNTTIDSDFRDMVISFNMTSEEFREVAIPHSLNFVGICKLGESLVVVGHASHAINSNYNVFLMGGGVSKSFTKLFTYTSKVQCHGLLLRKSGKLIIETQEQGDDDRGQLAIYEPYSNHVDNLGIAGSSDSFFVCDYMETLLLLDQKDLMVYK